ncbi:NUDIX domain-containing protein [Candidatus Ruthturnera calyptogenae]|uniref:NUDIX domain-containing protein n=1 Tax=Candidatus Ruthturnera calyptogenae TaxID=386487 RepID=UPI0002F26A2D|nr:NUDIX domain-containing protein [Candidatus Ruthturnera calyptogenae]
MDLGATLCTQRKPDCEQCPIRSDCLAQQTNTQNKYPKKKPKKNKATRSIAMLIFKDEHNIYLQKRPNNGICGGLWSFVECADNDKDIQQTIADLHPSAMVKKNLITFKHRFTHYHLLIHCQDVKGEFKSLSRLNIGVPKPVDNIICQLN